MGLIAAGFLTGLGAGINQAGNAYGKGIEKEQDAAMIERRMQVLADIQRESAKNQRADQFAFENDPANVTARQATQTSDVLARGEATRKDALATASDAPLNAARRTQANDDALAAAGTVRDVTKAQAGDAGYLAAAGKIKLADPEVAARIAASRAEIGATAARTGLINIETQAAKLGLDDRKKLNGLYDQAGSILSDASIDDATRAQQFDKVQRQIVLIKSKNGQVAGRDPELDTQTVTEEKMNPDGTVTKTQRKEVRRAGSGGGGEAAPYPDGTELKGKDGKTYVVQGGAPVLKQSAAAPLQAPTRKDPISGNDLTEREWDKKYGRGDFKNLYKPGEDALKPF
jgi:hypothetical protein